MRNEIILIIVGMALVTFATRFGCVALLQQTGMAEAYPHSYPYGFNLTSLGITEWSLGTIL